MLHLQGMRIAHADGQQQVQKELLRRRYAESMASTQAQITTNSIMNTATICLPTPPAKYRHWNRREVEYGGLDALEMTYTNHSVATVRDNPVGYPFAGYGSGDNEKELSFGANESETSFGTSNPGPTWNKGAIGQDLEVQYSDRVRARDTPVRCSL